MSVPHVFGHWPPQPLSPQGLLHCGVHSQVAPLTHLPGTADSDCSALKVTKDELVAIDEGLELFLGLDAVAGRCTRVDGCGNVCARAIRWTARAHRV
jgi:hypothetical protein